MFSVAKVLIENPEGKYLILHRNNHPLFKYGIDLPGGTVEKGEAIEAAAVREVQEEAGIDLGDAPLDLLISSHKYSRLHNTYNLYHVVLSETPEVTLSWEHSDYMWRTAEEIITESETSNDSFLRMTSDVLKTFSNSKQ